ncbi:AUGMIN subunit 2-like isoform X1 [Argentina anserina]|uniref:AUGMIN subunit 2-like isoform X1 n=1 Tax=Argentina anserina TaxID=57926 RepID=UPI00217645F0|nr:AUGMIN subunit 2-like isoform X1 [Potentilla anserina]
MSMGNESTWVGKKPLRRIGGMPDALSIASDLGFSVAAAPTPEVLQNWSSTGEKGDDLIRVLRELTTVQRKIADLQVELQGRKDDKNVSHLTHVSEMEMKCETLSRITTILNDVIQNKDRIIARLQQPYSLDCIPVEAEYQKQFSELLMKAASDYGALTTSFADFQWSQTFKEPPSVWGEMLRPIPVALASCTRFFEAMSAMRESFATLQQLRVGHSDTPQPITPAKDSRRVPGISDCVTPTPWKTEPSIDDLAIKSSSRLDIKHQEAEDESELDSSNHRRLSWPPSVKKVYLFNNQLSVWSPLQSVTVIFFKLVI